MSQTQQMVKHSTIYAVGNISRQLVGFLMLPIYTSYLTPADYGVIGLLIFLVSLFEIILGGHMFQAVPKFFHEEDSRRRKNSVVTTAFLITSFFSGFACLIMASFSTPLSSLVFGDEKYSIYIIIFSALILTHALEQYSLTYLRIVKKPWTFFNFSMAKLALQLSLNILTIVILDWGLMGLALSSLISSVIISITLTTYTIYHTGFHLTKSVAVKILKFSWPLWISGLIGLYIGSSNRYFIRIFSSLDDVGLFELASKFGAIVGVLVWSPFSQYWQTERFAIAKTANPYPSYSLAFRMITALLLVSGISVNTFSTMIIQFMSAPPFHPATDAVPFLVLAGIFQSLTIFNNFSFMYRNRTFELTKNNIVTAAFITAFYFVLIPDYGFVGASIALAAGSIVQYAYALHIANKIYPMKINQKSLLTGIVVLLLAAIVDQSFINQDLSIPSISSKILLAITFSLAVLFSLFEKHELSGSKDYVIGFFKKH
ncbi:lipopolysaccharide biosynthesis protein [Marinobacter sp. F4218]|uniref:lipopolysaccharide biosynthesis protein n=1 Tax=Marinobacter sp. F4218 TaxID=2862868 RepID=UPI001C624F64|nr:oligosaccharide flippase family protein [Marinobacter sp. F4218]MBW7470061.1 polysaccharide biosynthesis C-terminal domain-containing protein [Marinobacter sp. F4218]